MSQRLLLSILIVPLLLVGCFGSHGSEGSDAGPRRDDASICECWCGSYLLRCNPDGSCGGVCPDSGPPPTTCDCCGTEVPVGPGESCLAGVCDPFCSGLDCVPEPADLLCDFSHITANRPSSVPISKQGCFCEGHVTCSATVVGDHQLALATSSCTNPDVDCDECVPFLEGTCDLPPLDEGTWQIDVNGQPSFQLEVTPEDVLPERGSTCIRRGTHDESCGVGWPPGPMEPGSSCHPLHAWPNERVPITIHDPCGGCGVYAGPCKVDVFDDVIRVQPSNLYSLCDIDCPAICTPREDVCWTPRLEAGTWRVLIEGLDYESTLEISRDPETGEVCGPVFPHD